MLDSACIFCKIIQGVIPSFKLIDTPLVYAFLDINPLSKGHILIIPKWHGAKLHQIPDEHLEAMMPAAKRLIHALGVDNYNLLQNNGRLAHQVRYFYLSSFRKWIMFICI